MPGEPRLPESPLRVAAQDGGSSSWHRWRRSALWASLTLLLWGVYAQGLSLWGWMVAQGYVSQPSGPLAHDLGFGGFSLLLVPPLALGVLGIHLLAGAAPVRSPSWWLTWALAKIPAAAAAAAYAAWLVNEVYPNWASVTASTRSINLRPVLTLCCTGVLSSALVVALPLSWRGAVRHMRALSALLLTAPAMAYAVNLGLGWREVAYSLSLQSALGALAWSVVPIVGGVVLAWLAYTQPDVAGAVHEGRTGDV